MRGRIVDATGPVSAEFSIGDSIVARAEKPCWDGARYWHSVVHQDGRVVLVRIDPDGTVLDPDGITVAPPGEGRARDRRVSIDCGGDDVTVKWTVPSSTSVGTRRALVARVAADGTVLDPGGVEIAAPQPVSGPGPIVCRSGGCLAVWERGEKFARSVRATPLAGATELDPEGIDIITASPAQAGAVSAHAGDRYVSLWVDGRPASDSSAPFVLPIRGAIFTPAMEPIAPLEIGLPADSTRTATCRPGRWTLSVRPWPHRRRPGDLVLQPVRHLARARGRR